jgi:hypothetical protein
MANLDIKKLAKDMSLEDKAKLIFADKVKEAETNGIENLLTASEKDEIYKEAYKAHQLNQLNHLTDLFNLANLFLSDIQIAFLNFLFARGELKTMVTAIRITGLAKDKFAEIIYNLAIGDAKNQDFGNKEVAERFQDKVKGLRKKYGLDGDFFPQYDLYGEEDYFSNNPSFDNKQPNTSLQRVFIFAVDRVKALQEVLFQMDFIIQLAGFNFLSDEQQEKLLAYEAEIKRFTGLDDPLSLLGLYKESPSHKVKRPKKIDEPRFFEFIDDIEKAVSLTEAEKEKAKAQVNNLLNILKDRL